MSDPRGWEALTQQEAEREADAAIHADYKSLIAELAVAVRERDQAQEALRRIYSYARMEDEHTADFFTLAEIARAALAGGETVNQKPKGHTA